MKKGKELDKSIGSKILHHFVQRLLVPSVRQQVAKPHVLMRSHQNCSKQEERQHWTECTEYVWRSGKLKHSFHFRRKPILNSENYRTSALVSHASKIFFRFVLEIIRVKTCHWYSILDYIKLLLKLFSNSIFYWNVKHKIKHIKTEIVNISSLVPIYSYSGQTGH